MLHYQKYDVFYALPFFQNPKNQDLQARIFEIAATSILAQLVSIVYTVYNEWTLPWIKKEC